MNGLNRRALLALLATSVLPSRRIFGQDEVIQDTEEYGGERISAPIDPRNRQQNTGGSDGAGLCVLASLVAIFRDQGEHEIAEWIWNTGKKRPGGYWPERLDQLLAEARQAFPDRQLDWVSWTKPNWREFAKTWTAKGYSLGVTYGRAVRYNGKIAHMVALEHYGRLYACFMDNNFVERDPKGPRSWVPIAEADLRVEMMGGPWVVAVFCGKPSKPGPGPNPPPEPKDEADLKTIFAAVTASAAVVTVAKRFYGD